MLKPYLLCSLIWLLFNPIVQAQTKLTPEILADSLIDELEHHVSDTAQLNKTYGKIRKNRRNLKGEYLNLLHAYKNKSADLNYIEGVMEGCDRIGLQYRYDGVYDSAIIYHNRSLEIALELKDSTQLYYNYNNLGQAYRMQDLNVLAIGYFHQALSITEAKGNKKASSFTYNSLGAAYVVQKDYDMAMHYFRQSANIALQHDDERTLSYNYGAIGEVFLELEIFDSAMHYLQSAKELKLKTNMQRRIAVSDHLIAKAYYAMGNYTMAEKHLRMALPVHEKEISTRYLALCYAYMGMIKMQQSQFDSAYHFLELAEAKAQSIHSFENLILIYEAQFELNQRTSNWQQAIHAMENKNAYEDSIISIANARELQSLETIYKTHKKEQQIKLLSAENKLNSQRIRLGIGLVLFLILAIFLGIYVQIMRRRQEQFKQDELKQQLMLSQMNPHFIFNALGSIQSYMYKNDAKKAGRFLGNFASLTRSILEKSTQEYISLEDEIKTLEDYIELEKMRMNNRFEYRIICNEEVDREFIFVPPMLIQPFVENSIKHGLRDMESGGILQIEFIEHPALMEVHISDNGIGLLQSKANKDPKHKSKATEIFLQRMNVIKRKNKSIPEMQLIDLSTQGQQGTKAIIFLPIQAE